MPTDRRAERQWTRAQHAYEHYQKYISAKEDRCHLSFVDLIFIKNFKGGSATITEPVVSLDGKLKPYEEALRRLDGSKLFSEKNLGTIDEKDYSRVRNVIVAFAAMPEVSEYDISGFGSSFASALLHFYFPNIVPILDKRAINGCGIQGLNVDASNNVTNLLELYPDLIDQFRERLRENSRLSLRELDYHFFSQELRTPPFKGKN